MSAYTHADTHTHTQVYIYTHPHVLKSTHMRPHSNMHRKLHCRAFVMYKYIRRHDLQCMETEKRESPKHCTTLGLILYNLDAGMHGTFVAQKFLPVAYPRM